MNQNTAIHTQMIQSAKSGDEKAERFLRMRVKKTADGMPLSLLIAISELIVQYRRSELSDQAQLN